MLGDLHNVSLKFKPLKTSAKASLMLAELAQSCETVIAARMEGSMDMREQE